MTPEEAPDTEWQPGDRAIAWVRGTADVEIVRTDDPEFPWHLRRAGAGLLRPAHVKRIRRLS